jgi:hypothetical protein
MQELQHKGTGAWFLGGDQFKGWKDKPGSLWIRGNCESFQFPVARCLIGCSWYREKCVEVLHIVVHKRTD